MREESAEERRRDAGREEAPHPEPHRHHHGDDQQRLKHVEPRRPEVAHEAHAVPRARVERDPQRAAEREARADHALLTVEEGEHEGAADEHRQTPRGERGERAGEAPDEHEVGRPPEGVHHQRPAHEQATEARAELPDVLVERGLKLAEGDSSERLLGASEKCARDRERRGELPGGDGGHSPIVTQHGVRINPCRARPEVRRPGLAVRRRALKPRTTRGESR